MDCTALQFEDASFDFVIEKATLDTLACGTSSGAAIGQTLSEVARVLKPGGHFVACSLGAPESRAEIVDAGLPSLRFVKSVAIAHPERSDICHYLYVLKKL
jgi:ubiquinone/menaquinone biosynthesis C-methylase UbiE